MPQNMEVTDPVSKTPRSLPPQFTLRQPTGEIRNVDLNEEVPLDDNALDGDGDNGTPETPEQQTQVRDETTKNKPAKETNANPEPVEVDDSAEGDASDKETPSDKEVSFEKPDEVVDPHGRKVKESDDTEDPTVIPDGPRKYDEFPDQSLVPVLKALNNTQYKKLEPVLRGLVEKAKRVDAAEKQLQERPEKPVYSHENPEAYRLSKEYNDLEQTVQIGTFELGHWEQQLLKIANGEPWNNLGYDQQGNPVYTKIEAPTDGKIDQQTMLQIQNHLGNLRPEVSNVRRQAQEYRTAYQNQAKQSNEALEQIAQRVFPTLKDLSTVKPEEKALLEKAKTIIPPVFQGHPLVEKVFNRMVIFTERQKGKILSQMKEIKLLKAQLDDKRNAEPVVIPRGEGRTSGQAGGGKVYKYPDGRVIRSNDVVKFDED
jgi:hypothetical protein